jgi:O-antigen ligase
MRRIALWLSWLLLFILPFEYLSEKGALGSVVRLVGIALAGAWLLSVLAAARVRRPTALHGVMVAFAMWCGASVLWSLDPVQSRDQTETYLQLVLLALIVWDLYEKPVDLNRALQGYVLGCWVCIAELLEVFLSGDVQRRFSVGLFNENTLGFMLSLGVPIAWYLAIITGREGEGFHGRLATILRLSNLAFIPAALFGITLTASRSSMACGLLALGYMALSLGGARNGARILMFGGAAALAIYGVSFIPRDSVERLEDTSVELSDGDWNGRLPTWNEALRMIAERPVLGVGVSAFHSGAVESGAAPHNLVLSITAELGLIGFLIFSGILLGCGLLALRQPRPQAWFWLTMLGSWLLNALVHNFEDKKMTWLLFGLIAVSDRLYAGRQAAPAARPARPQPRPRAAPARSPAGQAPG